MEEAILTPEQVNEVPVMPEPEDIAMPEVKDILHFSHLPQFARFLREEHLESYVKELLRACREMDLPLMKVLKDFSEDQLLALSLQSHGDLLRTIENNGLRGLLNENLKKWETNKLEIITKDDIATEDITLGTYIRKRTMLQFLPLFTTDANEIIAIINEIDIYDAESVTASMQMYQTILLDRLNKQNIQLLDAEKVGNIASYEQDVVTGEMIVSPNFLTMYELESDFKREDILLRVHPDDLERSIALRKKTIEEGGNLENKYRYIINGKEKTLLAKGKVIERGGRKIMVGMVQDVTEREQLLESLQKSDALFKAAQAQTHIGNWTWDVIPNEVRWSDEMYRIYGMEPQSVPVSFDTYIGHVHPDYKDKRLKQVQHVFETGEPEDHIYRIITDAGEERILHSISKAECDSTGKVIRMTGTCQNITEKQRLVEKLIESESIYRQAQTTARMGSWTWDLKNGEVTWTDETYNIYDVEKDGKTLDRDFATSFRHKDDDHIVQQHLDTLLQTGETQQYNYRIVSDKGKVKILHAINELLKDSEGRAIKVIGTVQDVTEQKEAERKLKESREFIQKIADTTPSIITSYNINTGQYSYINEGLSKLLGYDAERPLKEGVPFFIDITHPEDLERIMAQNGAALERANSPEHKDENVVAEFKMRMRHSNGEYRWFHTFGTIFERDEAGKVESVLNISIDITAQEEAERLLNQKNIELQLSNTSLEEYAYVASHDLKEPLRKICTFSDRLLSTQDKLSDEGKSYLQKVIDSSMRMQHMISDLLSISLVAGNKAYETVNLDTILKDSIHLLESKIESNKAIINYEELPECKVVPSQFRQLFQNLINNSLKFARNGLPAEINIKHRYLKAGEIEDKNLVKAKKYLEITFSDNGIGFENEFANKIFIIFQRLHGRDEYEGTGIGLAICKKVVENHGGIIFAKGRPKQGATFTIILPVK